MQLEKLYDLRSTLGRYRESMFSPFEGDIGLSRPVIYLSDLKASVNASYYSLNSIPDTAYDIHVITEENTVLMYLIDVKAPFLTVVRNGMVIRTRKRWDDITDTKGIAVRYPLEAFTVLSNAAATATMFAKNVSADPKT